MDFFWWFVIPVVVLLLLILVAGIFSTTLDRRFVPDRYEWLEVLSFEEWRASPEVRARMQKRKGTKRRFMGIVFIDLSELEDEGLVLSRKQPLSNQEYPLYEFLRVPWGKKIRKGTTERTTLPAGPASPQPSSS